MKVQRYSTVLIATTVACVSVFTTVAAGEDTPLPDAHLPKAHAPQAPRITKSSESTRDQSRPATPTGSQDRKSPEPLIDLLRHTVGIWNQFHSGLVARPIAQDARPVKGNRTLRVQVVDQQNSAPIEGVVVIAQRSESEPKREAAGVATTDARGFVEFKGLDRISYAFRLQAAKPLPYIFCWRSSSADVDDMVIGLPKACELILKAVDAETGKGIPGVLFGRERAAGEYWLQDIVPDTLDLVREAPQPTGKPVTHSNPNRESTKTTPATATDSVRTDAEGRFSCLVEPITWSYSIAEFPAGYATVVPINGRQELEIETPSGGRVEYTFRLRKTQKLQ